MGIWDQIGAGSPTGASATSSNLRRAKVKDYTLPMQWDAITDTARFKAIRCPRRSGKTVTLACYILEMAERIPDARMLYVTQTLDAAGDLIIKSPRSGVRALAAEFGIKVKIRTKPFDVTWPNGAHLKVASAHKMDSIENLRGDALDLVVIDEAGFIDIHILEVLIDDILTPRLLDRNGTLVLAGTPGYLPKGPFFEAAPNFPKPGPSAQVKPYGAEGFWGNPRWSLHTWTQKDNTAEPELWDKYCKIKEQRGWPDDHPKWMREALGMWAVDSSRRIFRCDFDKVAYTPNVRTPMGLPEGHKWHYVLGVDMGFNHDSAFVVLAYADTHPTAYQVYEYSAPHMNVDHVAEHIRMLVDEFGGFAGMVMDSHGKQTWEAFNERYGWHFESAHKQDKATAYELLEGDFEMGHLRLLNGELITQLKSYQWDVNYQREAKNQDDHLIDAVVYAHKFLKHSLWSPPDVPVAWDHTTQVREFEAKALANAEARYQAKTKGDESTIDKDYEANWAGLDMTPGKGWY